MAQVKIIVVGVCLIAGLIAMAAAQSGLNCASRLQEHSGNYRKEAQMEVRHFADRLRSHSSDSLDIEKFRKQSDLLIERFIGLVDVRQGFSFERMSKAYTDFLESQVEMFQLFMRIDKAQDMTNEYYKLANSLSRMSTRYLLQAARDCLTGFRYSEE